MNLAMLLKEKWNRNEFDFLPEMCWMGCAVIWVIENHLWYCWEDEGFWPPLLWCWTLHGVHFVFFLSLFGVWCDLLVSADECVLLPQWNPAVSHSLVPTRSVLGHGWQWVAVSSPRSLQPSCPCQNSVSVRGCQLSKAWTSCLSSLPGWERSNANICTLVVWLGAAEKLLGTPKTFESFVFGIPKQIQNSPPSSTILWFFDCRRHQIEFDWGFLGQLELYCVTLWYMLAVLFYLFVNANKLSISAWNTGSDLWYSAYMIAHHTHQESKSVPLIRELTDFLTRLSNPKSCLSSLTAFGHGLGVCLLHRTNIWLSQQTTGHPIDTCPLC